MIKPTENLELPFGVILPEVSSLHISFNPYKGFYETIDHHVEGLTAHWISPEERERAIAQDTLWDAPALPRLACWVSQGLRLLA